MTDDWKALAAQIASDLELASPPVQISYLDQPPAGMAQHPGGVPSVCTFFSEGRKQAFFAPTDLHRDCEIGAYVMGIPPEGELGDRLLATVGLMQREHYLSPGEEARIPRNPLAPRFVAYGPLGSLPSPPTTVLLFARPKSAMLALEAAGGNVPMNGRPMCAIVPILNQGAPVAISLGCIGSRIYTQMGDDHLIVGVRGDHLAAFAREVHKIRLANDAVAAEDSRRKSAADAKRRKR